MRATLDMASCIDACDLAFASYSRGGAALPGVISLNIPERQGEVHVKAGHLHGAPFYAVKVASGFPRNVELGLPASDGMVIVFDSDERRAGRLPVGRRVPHERQDRRGGRRGREVPGAREGLERGRHRHGRSSPLPVGRARHRPARFHARERLGPASGSRGHARRGASEPARVARGLRLRGRTVGRRGRARRRRRHHVHREPVGVGARGVAEARRARHGRRIGRSRTSRSSIRTSPPAPTSWSSTAARNAPRSVSCITRSPPD